MSMYAIKEEKLNMMANLLINVVQVGHVCVIIFFTRVHTRVHVRSGEYSIHLANLNDSFVMQFKARGYGKSSGQNILQKSVSCLC